MNCIFDLKLSSSDVIAILAALVSTLSAIYARYSWVEAKKANAINWLSYRQDIYIAFIELKDYMSVKMQNAELSEVQKFLWPKKLAALHFPAYIASDINDYYLACFQMAYYGKSQSEPNHIESYRKYRSIENDLSQKIETNIKEFLSEQKA